MRRRALGLLSGGLDSALATALLLEQGLEVVALHFEFPTSCRGSAREVARSLGVPLVVREKGDEYLRLLRDPRWGYGRHRNPCVDCRVFMLERARGLLSELGASFLFTGEVLGQRPMSQLGGQIRLIDRQAGVDGLVVRPLSARLLPPTEPERRGWVDRSRLLAISGRSRRVQLAEAKRLGLECFDAPAGGCRLTEAAFARKIDDLFAHTRAAEIGSTDVELLAIGRHFRLGPALKIVLGRNAGENRRLAGFESAARWLVEPESFAGPSALVCGPRDEVGLAHALALIVRYADGPGPGDVVRWNSGAGPRTRTLGTQAAASAPDPRASRGGAPAS
ncbi:MAG TPA: 7-cyano-7-deazaguanine synthase [Terriglobales bacterium]|nr:7-cyano-7-deazaguanine synthase [Terriglobales bacterium]